MTPLVGANPSSQFEEGFVAEFDSLASEAFPEASFGATISELPLLA
jgi:hypothetical protein